MPKAHKMQTYSPYASYALIESVETKQGRCWQTQHVKVLYDYESAARLAAINGREDWAFALRTGRVMVN